MPADGLAEEASCRGFCVRASEESGHNPLPMSSYRFIDWATQILLALVVLLVVVLHRNAPAWWPVLVLAHLAIMAMIHLLVLADGRGTPPALVGFLRQFYPILLYTVFYRETELINGLVGVSRLDPSFVQFEHRLFGVQPSVALMKAAPELWLSEVLYAAYFSYYLMIAGVGAWLLWRNPPAFRHFVAVVSFVFYVCYVIYMFVPVVGPRLLFRDTPERSLYSVLYAGETLPAFPESVRHGMFFQVMAWIYGTFEARSAAFPSSHVAVAVTTLWFSWRYLRPIRWVHGVLAGLLCLSTVYCGYHYAVDVPAGILIAAILVPLGHRLYRRCDGSKDRSDPDRRGGQKNGEAER